jgi:16S rRNA (cytosine967-C5)-methyltransferase
VVTADGTNPPWRIDTFDRVLVDAPCTGLGALRRRPEARWRRRPDDADRLRRLQVALLDKAVSATRPGGLVAYVTCSPHPTETTAVIDLVAGHDQRIEILPAQKFLPEMPDLGPPPHAQLWPHRHGTDAMFISVLRRLPGRH